MQVQGGCPITSLRFLNTSKSGLIHFFGKRGEVYEPLPCTCIALGSVSPDDGRNDTTVISVTYTCISVPKHPLRPNPPPPASKATRP